MTSARQALCVAGLALVAGWLLWWTPAILFRLAQLATGRARFALVIAVGNALKVAGRQDAAAWLYEREIARCARRMAAIRARRGW